MTVGIGITVPWNPPLPCVGALGVSGGVYPGTVVWGACGAVVLPPLLPCVGPGACVGWGAHVQLPSGHGAALAAGAGTKATVATIIDVIAPSATPRHRADSLRC